MFNGLSKQISKWLAGFILACLFGALVGPLWATIGVKPTLGKIRRRADSDRAMVSVRPEPKRVDPSGQKRADQPVDVKSTGQSAAVNGSKVDVYLLARVIHAEARGESLEGQVAIGAVLLNRLKDPRFPKSLSQIVFKPGEFCTVRDGQVWLTPNDESIHAAKLAVAGWDPSGGALYFYNPAKTTSSWIWSRSVTNRIGHHIFAL